MSASSRKQIRHMAKSRMYARGRPQRRHRWYLRTLNFGVRLDFWISDFFAKDFLSVSPEPPPAASGSCEPRSRGRRPPA